MKRYFFRVFVSLIAFVIGIFAVWLLVSKEISSNVPSLVSNNITLPVSKELNGEIEVKFNDFIINDGNYFAELIVENNTNESIFYRAYELDENKTDEFAIYKVKVNGKEVDQMWCGTGLKSYEIKSGESKVFKASIWAPAFKLKNLKNTQIGFYLSTSSQDSGKIFWSKPFSIPNEIKQEIMKKRF